MKNLLGSKFVLYKGLYLQRGSVAWELFQAGETVKLDKHLKEVHNLEKQLLSKLP